MNTLTYSEKQRICESRFNLSGPFWHLCTDGSKMQNIFCSDEEFSIGLIALAVTSCLCPDVKVIAFELMNNHLHLILAGSKQACEELFSKFSSRLRLIYTKRGRVLDWSCFEANILPIDSLDSLRNEIIYTHRNAYVASPNFTPFSYPWGSGCAYFNWGDTLIHATPFDELPFRTKRELTHCRDVSVFSRLRFVNGYIYIPSFCDVRLGESMFTDARSYFNSLTRKSEAFSLIAEKLKDTVFLTDDELFQVILQYAKGKFSVEKLVQLSPEQRLMIARELHFKYNASNQQIRRLLRLELSVLNEMFP